MQANADAYILGTSPVPLMSANEEIERAVVIRQARIDLWTELLEVDEGPRAILELLRTEEPNEAKRLNHRLQRLARQTRRTERAMNPMAHDLAKLDPSGRLADQVIADFRRARVDVRQAAVQRRLWKKHKDHFVLANMGLVFKVAGRFHSQTLSLHDLVQDGVLGLMRAIDMFDPDRGFRFSTYAVWWIRHSMGRALADRSRTIRVPVHLSTLQTKLRKEKPRLKQELGREPTAVELAKVCGVTTERIALAQKAFTTSVVSLEQPRDPEQDPLQVPDEDDVGETLEFRLAAEALDEELGSLDRMEADVVRKRFGLERPAPMTLQEIGKEYALSRERIRQIELRALNKLRASMADELTVATR